MTPASVLREVRRWLLLRRRWFAALAAGGAVVLGLQSVQAPASPTAAAWTAAHDLPAGAVLARADLSRVAYPAGLVPAHASTPSEVVGRTLVAPLGEGTPLTDLDVVGRRVTGRYPGRQVVAVRLADAAAAGLLRPGDRVDLVAGAPNGDGSGHVVSRGARVVVVPTVAAGSTSATAPPGRLVLLAVAAADATDVATAGLTGYLATVWTG